MNITTPKIAIIGAGPGGLMLASILHYNDITCTVFERESSPTARQQGGTLDIHEHDGQQALDAAGLMDEFRASIRLGGDSIKILKKDGTLVFERIEAGEEQQIPGTSRFVKGNPEIDRPVLKGMLIDSLPADTILWDSRVNSLVQVPTSKQWEIELENGSRPAPFDLVIGADGAWSYTRSLLTDEKPFYSGVVALDVLVRQVDQTTPKVSALVGPGNCFCWSEGCALLFQRNGIGSEACARCYACIRTISSIPPSGRALLGLEDAEDEEAEIDWADARMRERFVERHFGDWSADIKRALLAMTDSPVLRPLYMLPVGFTWESRPGITLLGDAAHLMTPFAGAGVNVAMMDALELAQGIVDCLKAGNSDGDGLSAMVQRYEKGMFARSSKEAARTAYFMDLQFRHDGPERMVQIVGEMEQENVVHG
ncbi:FAD/NAD(P)-binding domain-containing protein [Xylaria nigripes]|nr:FAD/NAD(P)-binding domain-containing protein [Xylaria nigripes]